MAVDIWNVSELPMNPLHFNFKTTSMMFINTGNSIRNITTVNRNSGIDYKVNRWTTNTIKDYKSEEK
jgi:hypothetical protein